MFTAQQILKFSIITLILPLISPCFVFVILASLSFGIFLITTMMSNDKPPPSTSLPHSIIYSIHKSLKYLYSHSGDYISLFRLFFVGSYSNEDNDDFLRILFNFCHSFWCFRSCCCCNFCHLTKVSEANTGTKMVLYDTRDNNWVINKIIITMANN